MSSSDLLEAFLASHLLVSCSTTCGKLLLSGRKTSLYYLHSFTFVVLLLWVKVRNECLVLSTIISHLWFELRMMQGLLLFGKHSGTRRVESCRICSKWMLKVGQLSAEWPPTVRVLWPRSARQRAWHLVKERVCYSLWGCKTTCTCWVIASGAWSYQGWTLASHCLVKKAICGSHLLRLIVGSCHIYWDWDSWCCRTQFHRHNSCWSCLGCYYLEGRFFVVNYEMSLSLNWNAHILCYTILISPLRVFWSEVMFLSCLDMMTNNYLSYFLSLFDFDWFGIYLP